MKYSCEICTVLLVILISTGCSQKVKEVEIKNESRKEVVHPDNESTGEVDGIYYSINQKQNAEKELKDFANRYGGEFSGGIINALIIGEKDMFTHLDELSDLCFEELKSISKSSISGSKLQVIPKLDPRLNLNSLHFVGIGVENIDALAEVRVKWLNLAINPIRTIAALGSNPYIERLSLSGCSYLKNLPNMSGMESLSVLDVQATGIETLNNIDTIPHPFDIYLFDCMEIKDIDSLRRSNVRKLFVDRKGYSVTGGTSDKEGLYDRFQDWFEKNLPELEQKKGFELWYRYDKLE